MLHLCKFPMVSGGLGALQLIMYAIYRKNKEDQKEKSISLWSLAAPFIITTKMTQRPTARRSKPFLLVPKRANLLRASLSLSILYSPTATYISWPLITIDYNLLPLFVSSTQQILGYLEPILRESCKSVSLLRLNIM